MIRTRCLEIGAVLAELELHFVQQFVYPQGQPGIGLRPGRQVTRGENQADNVRQVMVAPQLLVPFEMVGNMLGVFEDSAVKGRAEEIIEDHAGSTKQVVGDQPVADANGHVHGAAPVDAKTWWVCGQEIEHLVAKLAGIAIGAFLIENVSPGQDRQVLHASQLPRHLHVSSHIVAIGDVRRPRGLGPAPARFEIEVPVDRSIAAIDLLPQPAPRAGSPR